jgi:hypothetical protein
MERPPVNLVTNRGEESVENGGEHARRAFPCCQGGRKQDRAAPENCGAEDKSVCCPWGHCANHGCSLEQKARQVQINVAQNGSIVKLVSRPIE